ncbi:MAG: DEAD/DEAH box helicase [Erysipelotrichaceae bacterium]|nr:DEAD/DEAH box helicase [Erysipelotrichaceae bacterium]
MNNIREETVTSLKNQNIQQFTEVQKQCIPDALEGKDILAQAPTGSGKTLAYLIPSINDLEPQRKGKHFPKVLILVPTRELALQVCDTARKLLSNREGIRVIPLTGGTDIKKQIHSFSKGSDIVVGTPSRILDHFRRHTFKPKECKKLVLDEADEMLSMGFEEDVEKIIDLLPSHQTLLFSATWNQNVKRLAEHILKDPLHVQIQEETYLKQDIHYFEVIVSEKEKIDVLKKIIPSHKQTLIFTNTRKTADYVTDLLVKYHYKAAYIHSEMDYGIRKKNMQLFRDNKIQILCATGVAERGIDIPAVSNVILYDLPDTKEELIHRTGRTARHFHKGDAYILVTPKEYESYQLNRLFKDIQTVRFHK